MMILVNQTIAIFIIYFVMLYFSHCSIVSGIKPSFEVVLKICSGSILFSVATILLLLPFIPNLVGWLKQAILPLTIVAILIMTFVLQSLWNHNS